MKDNVSLLRNKYRLNKDPFDSRVNLTAPMADRKEEQRRWTEVIERRKGLEGNSLNFIVGDYGLGKSYTLYQLGEQFKDDKEILTLHLKFLPEDTVQRFGMDFIMRIFRSLEINSMLKQLPRDSFDKLAALFPDVGTVMQRYFYGDELAMALLRGDRPLTATELKRLGARRKIVNTEIAKDYLLALLYLLRQAGILTLLLLVDEVEYVFSQMAGAKIASVFNTLRDLYDLPQSPRALGFDQPLANMIFFFGISHAGWVSLNDLEKREQRKGGPIQPFLDRKEEVIELQRLNDKETRELIELRLRRDRVEGLVLDKPLIPFTEDFVEYIFQLTGGNPRHIIERCDLVLLDGLRDAMPELNSTYAKQVLESHGLPAPPLQSRMPDTLRVIEEMSWDSLRNMAIKELDTIPEKERAAFESMFSRKWPDFKEMILSLVGKRYDEISRVHQKMTGLGDLTGDEVLELATIATLNDTQYKSPKIEYWQICRLLRTRH